MRNRLLWYSLSLTALLTVACQRDIAPGPSDAAVLSLSAVSDTLRPDLVVGREDGLAEEAFGRIADIALGPDGAIYVIDQQAGAVRVFDAEGKFVRSVGRLGDGPGEFRRPAQLTVSSDGALWVYDAGLRSVLRLDSLGRETERFPTTASGPSGGPLSSVWDGFIDADGRLVQSIQRADFPGGTGLATATNSSFVRRLDPSSGAVDSTLIAEDPIRRYRYQTEGPGGGIGTLTGIYSLDPRRLVAVGPDGETWTALSTEYAVTRVTPSGDSTVVRVAVSDTEVTDQELEHWSRINEHAPGLERPTQRHVLARLFVDSDGSLWVQRADGIVATGRLDIFEADGTFRRSVLVPATFQLSIRDGQAYAVAFDEFRVGRVVRIPTRPADSTVR